MFIIYKLYILHTVVSFSYCSFVYVTDMTNTLLKTLKYDDQNFSESTILTICINKRGFFSSPSKSHKNQIESNSRIRV